MKKNAGTTLIEILIVIFVFSLMVSLGFVSLLNVRSSASVSTSEYTLITDIKNQQIKAMVGDTEGRGTPDTYSIHIDPNQYVLFHGQSYSAGDSSNFAVPVTSEFTLSTTFANNSIVFASGSGEIMNFVQNQDTITFTNTSTNQQTRVQLNKYGVITAN
ncbi:MAG: Tfp pilus assembly protein FimT/FimU [Candidatus Levyibacteriota bacterium]